MSTQDKPKTPATPTPVAVDTSSEKATAQLKQQFSNLFNFFSKVSTDVATSSTALTASVTQNGAVGFLEALNKKVKEISKPVTHNNPEKPTEQEKEQPSQEKGDNTNREKTDVDVMVAEKEDVVTEKGNESHREKTPQETLKESNTHVQPPVESQDKPKSAKADPPAPRFNSFQDLFGSIAGFISQTTSAIQTGSSNVMKKIESGIDLNARVKAGFKPTLIKKEARKSALDNAAKKRLEEARKMKENFEKQLRSLDQEIHILEKGDDPQAGEASNRSRQGDQPKKFRISSQKSLREGSDKSLSNLPDLPKPGKKLLVPIEGRKQPGKRWNEGEKGLKSVASQPLYMRMEKEFQQNVIFPELEARKEKLKEKREFYKPMDDKELREHALKYEERKKNMQPENYHSEKLAPLNFAKSNAYKKVLEQEKEEKVKIDQKAEERKYRKEKAQQYAKLVKEMYFPKSDPKDDLLSKENLQEIIARAQKAELPVMHATTKDSNSTNYSAPKLQLKKKRASQDITQQVLTQPQQSPERSYVPHAYLKRKAPKMNIAPPVAHDLVKEHKVDMILPKDGFDDEQPLAEVRSQRKKNETKPRIVSMSPKRTQKKTERTEDEVKNEVLEPEMAKKSYPNYLVEVRKKRIEHEQKTGKGKYGHWEKVLKNQALSQQEKVTNILDDINRIESQAKKKEAKLRRHDPTKEYEPLELEDEVGEMYLESIKAKLAIIKDLA